MLQDSINLLIADNNSGLDEFVLNFFQSEGVRIYLKKIQNNVQMQDALQEKKWDLVITDDNSIKKDFAHPVSFVRDIDKDVILFHLTPCPCKASSELALKNGATRVIPSNNLSLIVTYFKQEVKKKEYHKKFLESQRFASLGKMSRGIVHDFNNTLNAVFSNLYAIKELVDDSEILKYIDKFENATLRATNLSKQLLEFSRTSENTFEIIDLNVLVRTSGEILNGIFSDSMTIRFLLNDEPFLFRGNKNQIEQVVFNLAFNARDAMSPSGVLTFKTDITSDFCILTISDTGKGIPKDTLEKIFTPFFSTKKTELSTGLGLSVVKEIIDNHNGSIEVESQPGFGTTFKINFPRIKPNTAFS